MTHKPDRAPAHRTVSDLDIYRTANLMIRRHGSRAQIEAAARFDKLLKKGDLDGSRVWIRVIHAIEDLRTIDAGAASIH